MIYYVDSILGNDTNNGTSRSTAFKTLNKINELVLVGGDTVLLKSNCKFEGTLVPKRGSGDGIITFSSYGAGEKPEIIGKGDFAVLFLNFPFMEFKNIAVTNPDGSMGIKVVTLRYGETKHIHINNCYLHDINLNRNDYNHETGGIVILAWSENDPCWFNDVNIEDNTIENVARTGIIMTSLWVCRPDKGWGRNNFVNDDTNWWPSKNVTVHGNYLDKTGGEGIFIIGTVDALIEWNTVYNSIAEKNESNGGVGIWAEASNNTHIQYNEVGHFETKGTTNSSHGFIVGFACRDTVIQYNYSHNNGGGFILMFESKDSNAAEYSFRGTILRNNLSINDGSVKGELISLSGLVKGVFIENNTFHTGKGTKRLIEIFVDNDKSGAEDITLRNNIFYAECREIKYSLANGKNFRIEHNMYWGIHHLPIPEELGALITDPKFKDPKTGNGWQMLHGYIPCKNSPAFFSGAQRICGAEYDILGNKTEKINYHGAFATDME